MLTDDEGDECDKNKSTDDDAASSPHAAAALPPPPRARDARTDGHITAAAAAAAAAEAVVTATATTEGGGGAQCDLPCTPLPPGEGELEEGAPSPSGSVDENARPGGAWGGAEPVATVDVDVITAATAALPKAGAAPRSASPPQKIGWAIAASSSAAAAAAAAAEAAAEEEAEADEAGDAFFSFGGGDGGNDGDDDESLSLSLSLSLSGDDVPSPGPEPIEAASASPLMAARRTARPRKVVMVTSSSSSSESASSEDDIEGDTAPAAAAAASSSAAVALPPPALRPRPRRAAPPAPRISLAYDGTDGTGSSPSPSPSPSPREASQPQPAQPPRRRAAAVILTSSDDEGGETRLGGGGIDGSSPLHASPPPSSPAASSASSPLPPSYTDDIFAHTTPPPAAPSPAWVSRAGGGSAPVPRSSLRPHPPPFAPSPFTAAPTPRRGIAGPSRPPPSPAPSPSPAAASTPASSLSSAAFARCRDALAAATFEELNAAAFSGRLPLSLSTTLVWNAKLKTTAGVTYTHRTVGPDGVIAYAARIELSTKVVDSVPKLRQTLAHELCHAAAWLLDRVDKPPHGAHFKAWGGRVEAAIPGLVITTCHSYDVAFSHTYVCSTDWCATRYGRHSASIDTAAKACGVCGGRLALQAKLRKDGTPVAPRTPSAFALFVKDHFAVAKANMPRGAKHGDVMRVLAGAWRDEKGGGGGGGADGGEEGLEGPLRALDLGPRFQGE